MEFLKNIFYLVINLIKIIILTVLVIVLIVLIFLVMVDCLNMIITDYIEMTNFLFDIANR